MHVCCLTLFSSVFPFLFFYVYDEGEETNGAQAALEEDGHPDRQSNTEQS